MNKVTKIVLSVLLPLALLTGIRMLKYIKPGYYKPQKTYTYNPNNDITIPDIPVFGLQKIFEETRIYNNKVVMGIPLFETNRSRDDERNFIRKYKSLPQHTEIDMILMQYSGKILIIKLSIKMNDVTMFSNFCDTIYDGYSLPKNDKSQEFSIAQNNQTINISKESMVITTIVSNPVIKSLELSDKMQYDKYYQYFKRQYLSKL